MPSRIDLWEPINSLLAESVYFADRVQVFVEFLKPTPEYEMSVLAYGVRTWREGISTDVIFESGSDGCIKSEIADRRRSASINAIIFYLVKLLTTLPYPMEKTVEVQVKTQIEINGIILPNNFVRT
jgi:hypothetical protein